MDKFAAELGELEGLARSFSEQADSIRGAIPGFSSAAYSVHDALGPLAGRLGPSQDVLRDYLETAQDAIEALGKLADRLELDEQRLRRVADNYRRADAAGTESFEGP